MRPLSELEHRASEEKPTLEGAWWIAAQMTEHLLTHAALRDGHTGQGLPDSLQEMLHRLNQALQSGTRPRPRPEDTTFRVLELCTDALQVVLIDPTTRLVREHEMVPLHGLHEVDQKTLRWISRRPGRTVREKLASTRKILAPRRHFTADTDENQVVRRFLEILEERLKEIHQFRDAYQPNQTVDQLVDEIRDLIEVELRRSELLDVPPSLQMRPNNVLLDDRRYAQIWRAAELLQKREELAQTSWQHMPSRARELLFWGLIARLTASPDVTLWNRPALIRFDEEDKDSSLSLAILFGTQDDGVQWLSHHNSKSLVLDLWLPSMPGETQDREDSTTFLKGRVKVLRTHNNGRRFGFIESPGINDVYFDDRSMQDPRKFAEIEEGQQVIFQLESASQGKSLPAKNIEIISIPKDESKRGGAVLRISLESETLSINVGELAGQGIIAPVFSSPPQDYLIRFDPSRNQSSGRGFTCSIPFEMLGSHLDRGQPIDLQGLSHLIDIFEGEARNRMGRSKPVDLPAPKLAPTSHDSLLSQATTIAVINFSQPRPSIYTNYSEELYVSGYAVGFQLPGGVYWQTDLPEAPLLAPAWRDHRASIHALFAHESEEDSRNSAGIRKIIDYLSRSSKLKDAKSIGYLLPDMAEEEGKKRLRNALETRLSPRKTFPIWRAVATATAWQYEGLCSVKEEGRLILVVDAEGPRLTLTPLLSRYDEELATNKPYTKGIFWERHGPLIPSDEDEVLTFSTLLYDYTSALLNQACGQTLPELTTYLVESGRIEDLLEEQTLTIPLPDQSGQWLSLFHDEELWRGFLHRWFQLFDKRMLNALSTKSLQRLSEDGTIQTVLLGGKPFDRLKEGSLTLQSLCTGHRKLRAHIQGTVKFANSEKNFGFIIRLDGKEDVFFRRESLRIPEAFDGLQSGTVVLFRQKVGRRGPEAYDLELMNEAPAELLCADTIAAGALALTERAHHEHITWSEWTPELGIEVIHKGHFGFLPLLSANTSKIRYTGAVETITIPEPLQVPAETEMVLLPLLSGDGGRELIGEQGCLKGGFLPLSGNSSIQLHFSFQPGIASERKLVAIASDLKNGHFRELEASWISYPSKPISEAQNLLIPEYSSSPQCPTNIEEVSSIFDQIQSQKGDEKRAKELIWSLADALGDGLGERATLMQETLNLIRAFRTTEHFNPALLNATLSALGNALWKFPDLVHQLPKADEDGLELLLHVSEQGLLNISGRLPALVDEIADDSSKSNDDLKLYASPYINICQLLLALIRLRETNTFPILKPTSKRIDRIARYIRRVDAFLAHTPGHTTGHWQLENVLSQNERLVPRPHKLRRVSRLGYQTLVFLLNGAPPLLERVD